MFHKRMLSLASQMPSIFLVQLNIDTYALNSSFLCKFVAAVSETQDKI